MALTLCAHAAAAAARLMRSSDRPKSAATAHGVTSSFGVRLLRGVAFDPAGIVAITRGGEIVRQPPPPHPPRADAIAAALREGASETEWAASVRWNEVAWPTAMLPSADAGQSEGGDASTTLVFPFFAKRASVSNSFHSVHGGALAALADVFTTCHLWGCYPTRSHVSLSLNVAYLNAAPVDTDLACVTRVVKAGQRVAFTQFCFVSTVGGLTPRVVAEGAHEKAFLSEKKPP